MHFAKKLIDETGLPMTEVAMAAGFGSIRRFNATFQRLYGRTPRELRGGRNEHEAGRYTFRLGYRPPYDWTSLIEFLTPRATPGVETVAPDSYHRTISLDGRAGTIAVHPVPGENYLELRICFPDPAALFRIVERVRRMFDLGADPAEIAGHLRLHPRLKAVVEAHPGLRVPGCWDGSRPMAVRAILGQQVSVKAATTMAGRIAAEFGFTAAALKDADLTKIGPTKQRAHSIRTLAGRRWRAGKSSSTVLL